MATKKKVEIGDLIDKMGALNADITAQNKSIKAMQEDKKLLEQQIFEAYNEAGITRAGGKLFTASITEEEVPKVLDWEKLYAFIKRHNAFYLLQRRAASPAMRELWDQRGKRPVPGVEKVTLKKLSFRKA